MIVEIVEHPECKDRKEHVASQDLQEKEELEEKMDFQYASLLRNIPNFVSLKLYTCYN